MSSHSRWFGIVALMAVWLPRIAIAETAPTAATFVPPPRTIDDITAILDQEKPDKTKIAQLTATADAQPRAGIDDAARVAFLTDRCEAALTLGRVTQALADCHQAVDLAQSRNKSMPEIISALIDLSRVQRRAGDLVEMNKTVQAALSAVSGSRIRQGFMFTAYRDFTFDAVRAGNFDQANQWLAKLDDTLRDSYNWKGANGYQNWFRYFVDYAHAVVLDNRGNFAQAEPLYRRSIAEVRQAEVDTVGLVNTVGAGTPPRGSYTTAADLEQGQLAFAIARRGRVIEGEVEARQALLSQLKLHGRYTSETMSAVTTLDQIIGMQGRFAEAEKLAHTAVDTYQTLGTAPNSSVLLLARETLAANLVAQNKIKEALAEYDLIKQGVGDNAKLTALFLHGSPDYTIAMLSGGQAQLGLTAAEAIFAARSKVSGEGSYQTAEAQGLRGAALAATGNLAAAQDAYAKSVPILLAASRHNDDEEDDSSQGFQAGRLKFILESYLGVLANSKTAEAGAEAFRIADAVRGQKVQRAVAAAAARTNVKDPALADVIRQDQDAQRQVTALDALVAGNLAISSDQRDEAAMKKMRDDIDKLKATRATLRDQIRKKFPEYAELIDPRPATVEQTQKALGPDEALFSVYVGNGKTYVWAVPKSGPVSFAISPLSPADVDKAVKDLRKTLDPDASTAGDIPAFDVATSYKLYAGLLEPVKAGWQNAKSLLIVPHGSLGQLPFGLLATQNVKPAADQAGQPLFTGYRAVPWLIRQVAVTQLPSVTSLTTLRATPATTAQRKPFIGFGDPWFSKKEEAQAIREQGQMLALQIAGGGLVAMRKAPVKLRSAPKTEGVNSADLAELPRLPDTAEEVRLVAEALKADSAKDVYLGAQANEQIVRTMKLDDRRVIMFATHGLIPGDLDGLTEPALALSAPDVAKVPGDGLLTVSEILGLRLNADWVVLSACNTASGNGAGAEAVSGLGLAFFYAGSRALLVSNWPVETTSARMITTELFKREAATPGLTRAESLRQAMLALMDGPGLLDPATQKPVYSYAHPIFWAPFSLVGDGGAG